MSETPQGGSGPATLLDLMSAFESRFGRMPTDAETEQLRLDAARQGNAHVVENVYQNLGPTLASIVPQSAGAALPPSTTAQRAPEWTAPSTPSPAKKKPAARRTPRSNGKKGGRHGTPGKAPRSSRKKVKSVPVVTEEDLSHLIMNHVFKIGTTPGTEDKETGAKGVKIDYQGKFDYSNVAGYIGKILECNPGTKLFLYNETETSSVSASFFEFGVLQVLIVPQPEMPPKMLRLTTTGGEEQFREFDALSLDWKDLADLVKAELHGPLPVDLVWAMDHRRVFCLVNHSRRSTLGRLGDDERTREFASAFLLDCRCDKFPYEIESAPYTCTVEGHSITSTYAVGGDDEEEFQFVVDEFEDNGIVVTPETVQGFINEGLAAAQSKVDRIAETIASRHDMEKISNICLAKIYPRNVEDVALDGARQTLEGQHYRHGGDMTVRDADAAMRNLEEAFKNFHFYGSLSATSYGPVPSKSYVFDGKGDLPDSPALDMAIRARSGKQAACTDASPAARSETSE